MPDLMRKDSADELGVKTTIFVDDKGQKWIDLSTRYIYLSVEFTNPNN